MEVVQILQNRVKRSKILQLLVVLIATLAIYSFYKLGSTPKISGLNTSYHERDKHVVQNQKQVKETLLSVSDSAVNKVVKDEDDHPIDVMITFTKAENNNNLQVKFRMTVMSLFKFASSKINLYILGDVKSEEIAKDILSEVADKQKYNVLHLDIDTLVKEVHEIVSEMQKYFSYKPGAYYSDSLFFMSLVIHKVLPDMHKVIMLDCDLKFNADIKELFNRFELFTDTNIMGIARDAQPVYRHNFHMYINKNKGTRVGAPPPDGLTGFNSGVLLLDLDKMRKSEVYNSLLSAESIKLLTEKFLFKGHLGDQDFYSLISLEHEELFHVLPCTWNRQLCTWWRDHGYAEVFDQYFKCEGHINIYHGNCNTAIPKLDWES
ncbi:xyloside xylosyltransferase 1-like [Ruditapes philippinarum]|uniref:xyloside xylosyltransferase 1-like n=1 Tax=Ruditapes philippinarum TaxID=129788 RepID=UPI00295B2E49|nr:xyloside xylosyltransferase 1-like [Ruditapes philippinarum]